MLVFYFCMQMTMTRLGEPYEDCISSLDTNSTYNMYVNKYPVTYSPSVSSSRYILVHNLYITHMFRHHHYWCENGKA